MDSAGTARGLAAFGVRLHEVAATPGADFTVSPLSIALAFSMVREGAKGATAEQIDAVLGLSDGPGPLAALSRELVTADPVPVGAQPLPPGERAPAPVVAVAGALFVDEAFADQVRPAYTQLLRRAYDARVTTLRLGDPLAAAEINAWVVEQTRGRIDRLFDSLPAGASLVLANAVYLRATWLRQFNPAMTVSGAFRRIGGSPVERQLMRQTVDGVRYAETADWQRVTLPYAGGVLAMRVVVPRAVVDDVRALAALLPAAARAETGDPSGWVDLTLPRWESHVDLSLVRPLAALGMTDVFDARAADLSGIAPGLSVSDAIHRATIAVDEEGTEAAAVTGLAMRLSMRAGEPVEMRVDRPFVWAIVHEPTGTPMFLGHVVDPAPLRAR